MPAVANPTLVPILQEGPPRPFELAHPTLGRKTLPRSDKHLRSPGSFKGPAASGGAAAGATPVVIQTDLPTVKG